MDSPKFSNVPVVFDEKRSYACLSAPWHVFEGLSDQPKKRKFDSDPQIFSNVELPIHKTMKMYEMLQTTKKSENRNENVNIKSERLSDYWNFRCDLCNNFVKWNVCYRAKCTFAHSYEERDYYRFKRTQRLAYYEC